MKYKWLYFLLSAGVLISGVFSLGRWGLSPSIDFTGGSVLELEFKEVQKSEIKNQNLENALKEAGVAFSEVQPSGENQFIIKTRPMSEEQKTKIMQFLGDKFGKVKEVRFETVGPTLGKELLVKTGVAVFLATSFILGYIAWRFRDKMYGVCAVLAMFHDTLILLGSFSLLGHFFGVEVDTLFVTAVLTILSFSVHDTVVVFDRVRESVPPHSGMWRDFEGLVNKAINETLIRSLNNSLTIIFMLTALILLGGETIRWFVVALLIGTVSGTYSSTFTAAPLLVAWHNFKKRKTA